MKITDILNADMVVPALRGRTKADVIDELAGVVAAFGRSPGGVDFQSLDGKPTHLFFLLVAPEDSAGAHLKALARISRLLKDDGFRQRLLAAPGAAELYQTIREEDDKY